MLGQGKKKWLRAGLCTSTGTAQTMSPCKSIIHRHKLEKMGRHCQKKARDQVQACSKNSGEQNEQVAAKMVETMKHTGERGQIQVCSKDGGAVAANNTAYTLSIVKSAVAAKKNLHLQDKLKSKCLFHWAMPVRIRTKQHVANRDVRVGNLPFRGILVY